MLCPECKKQIADDSEKCQFCGHEIDHKAQVPKEISLRRYQRWFFYGLITILIVGMLLTIVKIYNVNSELMANMALAGQELDKRGEELETAKNELAGSSDKLSELEKNLKSAQDELNNKADSYKEILFEKGQIEEKFADEKNAKADVTKKVESCEAELSQTDAMVYAMIVSLGVGIDEASLSKIPIAEANFDGLDFDGDGLSDLFEGSVGTDKDKADSDEDGFDDKAEILGGFNPLGEGSLVFDENFAAKQKGKILLQVENNGEAWYVNPDDGKRYFLGRPAQALELLANL